MEAKRHWESVYGSKAAYAVSWYAPHLTESLSYILRTGLPKSATVIDVGGGEATLVDDLLDEGYLDVSVLDISAKALDVCRQRLGDRAQHVRWISANVLEHSFEPQPVDIWHDRAVFHFLTDDWQRRAYVAQVLRALRPGGYAIVGTFGPEGPKQCSGLPVARYDPNALHDEFGGQFRLVESSTNIHTTPAGASQQFVYCFCKLQHDHVPVHTQHP
jgi:ubiquinone/menaquinone biosynthesis C-methylase UbiE